MYGIPQVDFDLIFPDGSRKVSRLDGSVGNVQAAKFEGKRLEIGVKGCEGGTATRCWIKNHERENENCHPFVRIKVYGLIGLRHLHDAIDEKIPTDIFECQVFGKPFYFGLRDNALLAVNPIIDLDEGSVEWEVYDNQHIRQFSGDWGSTNTSSGYDPASTVRPTLPGGAMVCWTLGAGFHKDAVDLPPVPDWRGIMRRLQIPRFADLPSRVQAMVRNWAEVEVVAISKGGVPRFQDLERDSFLFWAVSGASRFRGWDADPEGDLFEKRTEHFDSHPLVWGSLVNIDGATANHYNAAHGALSVWCWINDGVEDGLIYDPAGVQRNLAWWLASKWLFFSNTSALNWSDSEHTFGNDWFEKSSNGNEQVYPGEAPGFRSAVEKTWALNHIAAHVALPGDELVVAGLHAYRDFLIRDNQAVDPWVGKWSERPPSRRIIALAQLGAYLNETKLLGMVPGRVDEMISYSDSEGRNFEVDRNPSTSTAVFISAKAAVAVAFALDSKLYENDQQAERWRDWLAKRALWLADFCTVHLNYDDGSERTTSKYYVTPRGIPAAYNRGTVVCNTPAHDMYVTYPDNMFTDSWAALACGSALAILGLDIPGAKKIEAAWRGYWAYFGEGFDYLGTDIGETKQLVPGEVEFPNRVIGPNDGHLDWSVSQSLPPLDRGRRADHWQFGNWNNKKPTFALIETVPGCIRASIAIDALSGGRNS